MLNGLKKRAFISGTIIKSTFFFGMYFEVVPDFDTGSPNKTRLFLSDYTMGADSGKTNKEVKTTIRQVIDKAQVSEKINR